ncbi:Protein of unknown function [Halopseudomonas formosensis]|uniref:YetF C-terminal domain-containing protein n=1 Tax=Halopseudomonas formosensis TaxID=1002526 RepID=A0A1I6C2A5_9GAMM|nr:Protein of unknown function [Halopseudomonas formosensis]
MFRIAGRRALSDITTLDFLLLLVIGQATGQALLGDDHSVTNAVLVIISLILFDLGFSLLKRRSSWASLHLEGEPMIVVEQGRLLRRRMDRARISESDILEAARISQGLERLDQIKFAILERNGQISIIAQD